jgi:hypothetical protein
VRFQRLWNRNNPTDTIAEDGQYGPSTESRLAKSPIGGFRLGPSCPDGGATDAGPKVDGGAPIDPPDLPNNPAPEPDAPEPDAIPEGQTGEPLAPLPAEASGCSAAKDGSGLAPWSVGLGLGLVVARRRRNRA